jgi:dolichyl-phosphate-mannose-protein mannosyltransferase
VTAIAAEPNWAVPKNDDPLVSSWVLAAAFFVLALIRIEIPTDRYFDEQFYIPAAARLLLGFDLVNREHPMLAKELMALSLAIFGNQPFGWRIGSVVAGSLGLFAAMRAMWWYSANRQTTLIFGVLLATHGLLLSLARMAMLDAYMFAFAAWAVMLFAQRSFAASGAVFGLALACKWSVLPVIGIFGLIALLNDRSWRPILWFAMLPLLVYFLTFLPGFFVEHDPLTLVGLLPLQWEMAQYLAKPMRFHPYGSAWWHWVLNLRPMWLFHNEIDGAYRLAIMGGNPLSNLAIVPAVAYGLWRRARLPALAYLVCLGFWMASGKPVQYYYHYLLASTFGLAAVALVIVGRRWALPFVVVVCGLFVWLYPAMTGAAFKYADAGQFNRLPGWQFRDKPAPQSPRSAPSAELTPIPWKE